VEAAGLAPYTACSSITNGTGKVLLFVQTSECGKDSQADNVADDDTGAAAGVQLGQSRCC